MIGMVEFGVGFLDLSLTKRCGLSTHNFHFQMNPNQNCSRIVRRQSMHCKTFIPFHNIFGWSLYSQDKNFLARQPDSSIFLHIAFLQEASNRRARANLHVQILIPMTIRPIEILTRPAPLIVIVLVVLLARQNPPVMQYI